VQRESTTPTVKDPDRLTSDAFSDSERCQTAYQNHPPLQEGERSDGVKRLQAALIRVHFGHLMPKTLRTGSPDGIYGAETHVAVKAFQQANGVRPVGGREAGHKTLLALDKALIGPAPQPTPPATDEAPATVVATEDPGSRTDNGNVVQKPVPQLVPTSTKAVKPDADEDDKLEGHVVVNVGGAGQWNTAGKAPEVDKPHNKDLDPLCEHGVMQLGSQINVPWQFNPGSRRLKLVSEFELDVDFAPTLCKNSPTISVQVAVLKTSFGQSLELALNASMGLQNPPLGWFGQGAVEFDIKPFRSGILKPLELDLQLNVGGLIVPQREPAHDFKTGTFGYQGVLKYTF